MSDYDEFQEEEYSSKLDTATLKRITGLVKPHLRWVVGFFASIILISIVDAYFTYISKHIIDDAILAGNLDALKTYAIRYGALIIVQAVMVFLGIFLVMVLGERIRYDLRKSMFNHLQELALHYYSKTPVGWIMSRVTSDSERVSDLMTWAVFDSTWGVVNIITSAYFMALINWRLALIVLAVFPFLLGISIFFRTKIIYQFAAGAQSQFKDHRIVQRKHHRRAGGEGARTRGR